MEQKRRIVLQLSIIALLSVVWAGYTLFIKEPLTIGWEYIPYYTIKSEDNSHYIEDGELPYIGDSSSVSRSPIGRYTYHYNPQYGISNWVAYSLTREEVELTGTKRTNRFHPDSALISKGVKIASPADYYRSGYNRGHLLPSSDRDDSRAENITTFNFVNIAPQLSRVNSGVWLYIEHKVKEWAYSYGRAYITVGTIVEDSNRYIGKGKITIPTAFYKAVAVNINGEWFATAFIVPNSIDIKNNYEKYRVSIDKLEDIIDLDLFPNLSTSDSFEKRSNKDIFL